MSEEQKALDNTPSLSARRAWIEIGVGLYLVTEKDMSLSARRAWIEIVNILHHILANCVALRKESVDRNIVSALFNPLL